MPEFNLLLIYRPQENEWLSWPCLLTYSGQFTPDEVTCQLHVMAQARKSSPVIDRCSNHCAIPPTSSQQADNSNSNEQNDIVRADDEETNKQCSGIVDKDIGKVRQVEWSSVEHPMPRQRIDRLIQLSTGASYWAFIPTTLRQLIR